MEDYTVQQSCDEVNKESMNNGKSTGQICPECKADNWHCYHGVNPSYQSQYNPGEFIQYICVKCNYRGEEIPC